MVEGVLGQLSMRIITIALDSWKEQVSLSNEITQFRHLIEAAVRLADAGERRLQVSPLLNPLQGLLHRVHDDHEKAYAIHLALAAAYAAIDEEMLQFHHLNRACDCAVRVMQGTWWATRKSEYRRLRDELLEVLGERRKVLIG